MSDFRRGDFDEDRFTLQKDIQVTIKAVGMSDKWEDEMVAYGWILNSQTREVAWQMTSDNTDRGRERYLRKAEETLNLPAGSYEIYFAISPMPFLLDGDYHGIGDFLDDLFSGFRGGKYRRDARYWGISVWVDEKDEKSVLFDDDDLQQDAIIQMISFGDDEFETQGFSISKRTLLRIYALGEGDDGEMNDYCWIVNAETRDVVWEMDYRRTRWAGGAEKNRVIDQELTLPEGSYIVYYVSDGSHSYDNWNTLPPLDPRFWGVTIWGSGKGLKKEDIVKIFNPEDRENVIVDITRIGNDDFESEQFSLSKTAKIHVRCLGEMGYDRKFADYGYIMNIQTREIVWEMTRRNTQKAGGAKKNRMFDGVLTLQPGNYEVSYLSDGTHAYRRWNAGPPYDPEAWGITLWGAGDDFDSKWIKPYQEEDDPDFLVQIVRVGDRERIRRNFVLDKTTNVRIYAIGEGDDDDMWDYGWIEDERGRRVWRMEYWDTEHAGGASKNRMINEVIQLRAGEYTVRYRTDGTHSFDDWNSDPPHDPMYYGITIRIER